MIAFPHSHSPLPADDAVRATGGVLHRRSSIMLVLAGVLVFTAALRAQQAGSVAGVDRDRITRIVGDAFTGQRGYDVLGRMCDEAGGRLAGTPGNVRALEILAAELRSLGIEPRLEPFRMPGFFREDDVVAVRAPFDRRLRAVALGYVHATPAFEAPLRYAEHGYEDQIARVDLRGVIALVTQERAAGREEILRSEVIAHAARAGARAVLFINEKPGGLTLAGMSNFHGERAPVPAYSLTFEEGMWLRRLLDRGIVPRLHIDTRSRVTTVETWNVVASFPGERPEKIVIGAHVDSWDVGQGGVDNGHGTAILFDVARLLERHRGRNTRSIELVWFNGEELGLWGAKKYWEAHREEPIVAMINMDMTGSPRGFNAMGTDTLMPFLRELVAALPGFDMQRGVVSTPWTNSDHMPFLLGGVPTLTVLGHLDEPNVRYYHDFGDTFDKASRKYLAEAAAVVTALVTELASREDVPLRRAREEETIDMLVRHKLAPRLKKQGEWPFANR